MKKVIENPNLEQLLKALESSEALFITPSLKHSERDYYNSLFNQYAPEGSISFLSSGSSGNPKIIVHSKETLIKRAKDQALELGMDENSHYLNVLPLHHLGGFMPILRAQSVGAKLSIKNKEENLNNILDELKPTHTSMVPTQLNELVKDKRDLSYLKSLLLGGAGCSKELLNKAKELLYPIRACYGMTESASFFSISDTTEFLNSGEIKLKLMSNWSAFAQDSGRLTIESEEMFLGSITGNGFLKSNNVLPTFDIGDVEYPYINIYGRSDLVFKSGGEKVDPLEVENKLSKILIDSEVVIIPKIDSKWGHITCAFISPFDKHVNYADQVKELPPHQRPKHFFELQTTDGIKPKRSQLKEEIEKRLTKPKAAFLHGFMGTESDLVDLAQELPLEVNFWSLPDHGKAPGFNNIDQAIEYYSKKAIDEEIEVLYGYSMGGRLALAVAENLAASKTPLKALILESAHPGIACKNERLTRLKSDLDLFKRMPAKPEDFFEAWYSLPLFGDFKETKNGQEKISYLINNWTPNSWLSALSTLSTGHQKDYRNFIQDCPHPILYLSGEKDLKYKEFGQELSSQGPSALTHKSLKNGHHNLHSNQLDQLKTSINDFLSNCI